MYLALNISYNPGGTVIMHIISCFVLVYHSECSRDLPPAVMSLGCVSSQVIRRSKLTQFVDMLHSTLQSSFCVSSGVELHLNFSLANKTRAKRKSLVHGKKN